MVLKKLLHLSVSKFYDKQNRKKHPDVNLSFNLLGDMIYIELSIDSERNCMVKRFVNMILIKFLGDGYGRASRCSRRSRTRIFTLLMLSLSLQFFKGELGKSENLINDFCFFDYLWCDLYHCVKYTGGCNYLELGLESALNFGLNTCKHIIESSYIYGFVGEGGDVGRVKKKNTFTIKIPWSVPIAILASLRPTCSTCYVNQ